MKKIVCILVAVSMMTMCGGCSKSSDKMVKETYSMDQVKEIKVTSEANNIIIGSSSSNTIEVEVNSSTGQVGNLANNVLTIEMPEAKPGIHISEPSPLHINIPAQTLEIMEVNTFCGNIDISSIEVKSLSLNSDDGKITISNMSGVLSAKTQTGIITTSDSKLASQIVNADTSLEQSLNGQLGVDTSKTITISTQTGEIKIN